MYGRKEDKRFVLNKKKECKIFILLLGLGALLSVYLFYDGQVAYQNTTGYALTYKYGLIPRGLIGSLYALCNHVLPIDMYNYQSTIVVSAWATAFFFALLFYIYWLLLEKVEVEYLRYMEGFLVLASIVVFPMFLTIHNFGRLDEYLFIISLLCLIILLKDKGIWLIFPLIVAAGLIHVGFIFTNSGLLFALIFRKAVYSESKKRRTQYGILFITSAVAIVGLFLYLEVFRSPISIDGYEELYEKAIQLSEDGKSVSEELMQSELLLKDVSDLEAPWHLYNRVETPIFLVLFSPYVYLLIRFIMNYFRNKYEKNNPKNNVAVFVSLFGVMTLVPEFMFKVDYSRWFFCGIFYYLFMIMFMLAEGDRAAMLSLKQIVGRWKRKNIWCILLCVYMLVFIPFKDLFISTTSIEIAKVVVKWLGY